MKFTAATLNLLQQAPLLNALQTEQFQALLSTAQLYDLAEGELLFQQGQRLEQIFICTSGFIKLFRLTPNGDEKIVEIISAGNSFAEAVLFLGGQQYPVHAVALKTAQVVGINAEQYQRMLRESVDVCFHLMGLMSKRMHWLLTEVDRLTLHNATFRLLTWLLEAPVVERQKVLLDVPKHVLASRLSIKPETLSRILKRLTEQQFIRVEEQKIVLLERAALQNLVDLED
ncbi:MAG: Crp/Fnr family transcriptional regulator [Thiothrix sp.]|nr:MAG: Crp/Fnr family transcriptional regulator [Thiothrix sp.]